MNQDTLGKMSKEQLMAFLEKAKADSSLQGKLINAKSAEEVVSIARDQGHDFTADKLSHLSPEDLEGIAGGGTISWCGGYC